MGLFSWVSITAKKSEATGLIQSYLELSKQEGIFLGDPGLAAHRLTEFACNRVPELAQRWKGKVLAASVLTVNLTEGDGPLDLRNHCAMALYGMLRAAIAEEQAFAGRGRGSPARDA